MRMYIHTSLLTYLRPEFCFIWAAGGVGGLKGDVMGVGNPLDALKDPSDDLGNRSVDFGVLHSPAYVTAYSKIALTSNALYCTTFSFTRQTLVTFAPADPITEEKTIVKIICQKYVTYTTIDVFPIDTFSYLYQVNTP